MSTNWDALTAKTDASVTQQVEAANRLKNALGGMYTDFETNAVSAVGNVALAWDKLKAHPAAFATAFAEAITKAGGNVAVAVQIIGQVEAKLGALDAAAKKTQLVPSMPPVISDLKQFEVAAGGAFQTFALGADAAAARSRDPRPRTTSSSRYRIICSGDRRKARRGRTRRHAVSKLCPRRPRKFIKSCRGDRVPE